jgi:hypothetical protein
MYQGNHALILAAYRGPEPVAAVGLPPAYYLSDEEMARLRFIRWLLNTGRITK